MKKRRATFVHPKKPPLLFSSASDTYDLLEANLECAIAGVPLTAFGEFMLRCVDKADAEAYDAAGLSRERIDTACGSASHVSCSALLGRVTIRPN
jgi:hypothetical protein